MLTADKIKNIASQGEGHHIDFKRSVPSKVRELSEDICAFSNSDGGVILIGIDDDNKIIGVNIDNGKRSTIQGAIRAVSPMVSADMYSVDVDGKTIWIIDVPEGKNKPYTYSGAIYERQGATSQKLTDAEEIRNFYLRWNRIHFDAAPCPHFNIDKDFDKETFNTFLYKSSISKETSQQQILENLEVFDKSGTMKNGGVLFFGERPERFFMQAVVHCVRFKGTERIHIIDDKTFKGSLYQQYIQAEKWLKEKMEVEYIMKDMEPRTEIWEIPLSVFKEAIINALCHRDYYQQGAVTMVEVYDDRVEISNPGGLLEEVKRDFGHKSASRNPLVVSLFTRMDLVEKVASGIPRMRRDMKDAGLPAPIFHADGGFFTVEFKRPRKHDTVDSADGITNDITNVIIKPENVTVNPENVTVNVPVNVPVKNLEEQIFELIKNKQGMSAPEITAIIGKNVRTTKRYIAKLRDADRIEFRGADKTGGYYLKS
jgi:ATP-dependent DNA helicase RecG